MASDLGARGGGNCAIMREEVSMEKESFAAPKASSNKLILVIAAVVALCLASLCCLLLVVAILFLQIRATPTIVPLPQVVPLAPTSTVAPPEPSSSLDPTAAPLFGSTSLQRGFTPDPFFVEAQAGGTLDTSTLDLACGFTTPAPSFTFRIGGGASDTFLRIFFTANDSTDTTLGVLTPHQEWKCADDSSYGGLKDPVIDFDMAPSGKYVLWVGTKMSGTRAAGKIYITASQAITP
jgi:hypothetical protein